MAATVTTKPQASLVVKLRLFKAKATLALTELEMRDYLSLNATEREAWIDDYLDAHADAYEIEEALVNAYEVDDCKYDGPESLDDLPPYVDPNQMSLLEAASHAMSHDPEQDTR